MATFNPSKQNVRNWLLYEYLRGSTATLAATNINDINKAAINIRQAQEWFARFRSGDFNLNDHERSGRPSTTDDALLEELINSDPRLTTEQIQILNRTNTLGCSATTVKTHLHMIGKSYKAGVWVPHELTEKNKAVRQSVCQALILKNNSDPFLQRIVTGDEKWIQYHNPKRQKQLLNPGEIPIPTPKPGLHPKKAMLCIWWDCRGVIYWELLGSNQTIDSNKYCDCWVFYI